jgi:hypothetical protein
MICCYLTFMEMAFAKMIARFKIFGHRPRSVAVCVSSIQNISVCPKVARPDHRGATLGRETQFCDRLLQWARMRARAESIRRFCVDGGWKRSTFYYREIAPLIRSRPF